MTDDFIRGLQGDWRSQQHGTAEVLHRLRRHRWTPHLVLGGELLACAFAFLVGLWFAWVALHEGPQRLLFALSATILLLSAPALGVAGIWARRASLAWDAETPESLLKVGMRRADSRLRAIRVGRWHIAVIAMFLIALWVIEASGHLHAIDFLTLYTAVCVVISAAGWFLMQRWETRARGEHAACVRLLAELKVDGVDDGAR